MKSSEKRTPSPLFFLHDLHQKRNWSRHSSSPCQKLMKASKGTFMPSKPMLHCGTLHPRHRPPRSGPIILHHGWAFAPLLRYLRRPWCWTIWMTRQSLLVLPICHIVVPIMRNHPAKSDTYTLPVS